MSDLESIRRHVEILNEDYTKMVERISHIETDVSWVKWLTMLITGGVILTVFKVWFGGA